MNFKKLCKSKNLSNDRVVMLKNMWSAKGFSAWPLCDLTSFLSIERKKKWPCWKNLFRSLWFNKIFSFSVNCMVKCIKVLILRKDTHLLFIKLINLLFETTIHGKHSQQKSYFNFWCFKKVLILYLLNHIMSACQSWKIKVSDVNVTTFIGRGVVPGGAEGAMAPPDFSRSVNPISTRSGRLCPPH